MADSAVMWFRCVLIVGLLLVPASVRAQTWTACIDPRTGGLTTEGFRAIRDAAAASSDEPGGRRSYDLRRSTSSAGEPPTFRVVQLEMMYAGVGPNWIGWEDRTSYDDLPEAAEHCFEITAGNEPPGLWHYWGPYFDHGSAVVPAGALAGLEYVIPGYLPGRTIYRLKGYADTSGSVEVNHRLGAARTEAVARELVRMGVQWSDIEQQSFGESQLARPTADGVAEPLNRRVLVDVRVRPEPAR